MSKEGFFRRWSRVKSRTETTPHEVESDADRRSRARGNPISWLGGERRGSVPAGVRGLHLALYPQQWFNGRHES